MKKLLFSLVIVLGAYFIFVPNNETLAQRQDIGGRGGGGGNITGAYAFAAAQFSVANVTQVSIAPSARVTNMIGVTGLNLEYATASRPLLTDGSKNLISGLLDFTSGTHFQVPGALSPYVTNAFPNTKIIAAVTASAFTNAILDSVAGETIVVPAGTYVIPAMTNMAKKGVNWVFHSGGVKIISMGGSQCIQDSGGATTNSFVGPVEFVISNNISFLNLDVSGSRISLDIKSIWKGDTNHSAEIFAHNQGRLVVRVSDFIRSEGYDIYVNNGTWDDPANFYVDIKASEWIAAEDCIEIPGPIEIAGRAFFEGSIARKLTNTVSATSSEFMLLSGHVLAKFGTIHLGTNATIQGTTAAATDGTIPKIEAKTIFALQGTPSIGLTIGGVHIVGARLIGPPDIDPINLVSRNLTLENCEIISGSGSTNTIRASSALQVFANNLTLDKSVHANITLRGGARNTNTFFLPEIALPARPLTNTVGLFAIDIGGDRSRFGWIDDSFDTNIFSFSSKSAGQAIVFRNGVFTNETVSGSGDVTAAANFGTDNRLIRSDGTGKGVQTSIVDVSDTGDITTSGNITGGGITGVGGSFSGSFDVGDLLVNTWALFGGPITNVGALYNSGDIFAKSLTATNGMTNYGPFIGIGTNNGAIRLAGTNTGFAEHTVFASGPSNNYVWSVAGNATFNQALVIFTNITQAGTNQIVITNGTAVGGGSTFNSTQFDSSGDVDILSGALVTNLNLRGTSPYNVLEGNTLTVTGLLTSGSVNIRTNLSVVSNAFFYNITATNSITVTGTGNNGVDNLTVTNWSQVNGPQTNTHQNGIRVQGGGSTTNFYVAGMFYALNQGFTNRAGDAALTNAASVNIPAHMLTNLYDQVNVNFSGAAQSETATTNQIKVLYGSETLLDTGLGGMSNSAWRVEIYINRTGNSNQICQATVFGGMIGGAITNITLGTLQTNGINTTLQLQLASRKPGGITNDYVHAKYFPAPR